MPKFGQSGFGSGAANAKPFGGFSAASTLTSSTSPQDSSTLALKPATGGFASFANSGTSGSSGSFANMGQTGTGFSAFSKPAQTNEQKPTGFAAFAANQPTPGFGVPGAFSQPKSVFGQPMSVFGKPAFGSATPIMGDDKKPATFSGSGGGFSAFSKPTGGAVTGSGFGAFAGGGGFASLAPVASSIATPAFAEAGSGDEIKKDNILVFGQSQKKEEVNPFTSLTPTHAFGSGTTKPTSAFSSFAPRATPQDDDDDISKGKKKEAFPEDAADDLEPKNVHTGPGLFGTPNMNITSTSSLQSRLGQVALSGDKRSLTPPREEKRMVTVFGQKIDPDAKTPSLWATAGGGSASAFLNAKPGTNKSLFGSFGRQAAGQSSSAFRPSSSTFVPYESKTDSEGGSDGEDILSETEGRAKPTKATKNKEGYLTPDEGEVEEDDEEEEEEEDDEEEEEEEEDLADTSDEEDEGLPVVEEGEEEEGEEGDGDDDEEESGSAHEEHQPIQSSTPKDGSKTTFHWKEGALDNAASAKPASSSGQRIPWHGFSASLGPSQPASVSSPSPLLPQATTPKRPKPVIMPVPKLAMPLFGGSGAQSDGNTSNKISTRPKTPPGLFSVEPTTAATAPQSDLQSRMANITPTGSTSTPKPQSRVPTPAPPRSKYQELQDQLHTMLTNALGHNDEVRHIVPYGGSV